MNEKGGYDTDVMANNKHLTLSERIIIETGVNNNSSKTAIAQTLGKDPSTIGKEISLHRFESHRCSLSRECNNYKDCHYDRKCGIDCDAYEPFFCKRRDKSPGVCNGCSSYSHCRYSKYRYSADQAQHEYEMSLHQSRQGFNTTTDELKRIGNIMKPLLDQGLSVYVIKENHPEIKESEKTLYTYIESGIFKDVGIDIGPMDLRRQVNRKLPTTKAVLYKLRQDRSCLISRKYEDYKAYMKENPDTRVVEMDTVYNDVENGPFIQTFKLMNYSFLFALYQEDREALAMNEGVLKLEEIMTPELFQKEVQVLLTDRGSEFLKMPDIERNDEDIIRTRVFYCDPMASHQKGSLENNHIELRYICPKEYDLKALGLTGQEALNLALSHVNSFPKENLNGHTPFEVLKFFNPELYEKLIAFGLQVIEKDQVILKPSLLSMFRMK